MSALHHNEWTGFVKLFNENNLKIEAAMCERCQMVIKYYGDNGLHVHRQSCETFSLQKSGNIQNDPCYEQMEIEADSQMSTPSSTKHINKFLAKFFLACNIPFKVVENLHFHEFVTALTNTSCKYHPPCRQTLASSLVNDLHHEIIEERKKVLRGTPSVLLVDGWRNKSINRKFLVFTLRNENTRQTFLTFSDVSLETEYGDTLTNKINEVIEFAKEEYETEVYGIVTDNDSKIVCGGRSAISHSGSPLWQATCSSHSGNLFLKTLIESDFADIVREVVVKFKEPKLESLLINQGGTKLRHYPDTRFCFFRDSCQSILKNLYLLKRISMAEDVLLSDIIMNTIHDANFEEKLIHSIEILEPVCKLINKCQEPTLSIADATEMWVTLLATEIYDSNLLNARIKKAIKPVGYAANILHPCYLGKRLNDDQYKIGCDFFAENFSSESLEELNSFMNDRHKSVEKLLTKCKNPITFWKLSNAYYPNLANDAIKSLLIPASTAQLEGLFSQWTYVHNSYRNRLTLDKSGKLIDIYYTLRHSSLSPFR